MSGEAPDTGGCQRHRNGAACAWQVHAGKDGTSGNPAEGSSGPLARQRTRRRMASLRIGVPPGTVVKKQKGGKLLGELINPGNF